MIDKKQLRKTLLGLVVVLAVCFVLFSDASNVNLNELTASESGVYAQSDQYLFPEAKIFLRLVKQLIDIIV